VRARKFEEIEDSLPEIEMVLPWAALEELKVSADYKHYKRSMDQANEQRTERAEDEISHRELLIEMQRLEKCIELAGLEDQQEEKKAKRDNSLFSTGDLGQGPTIEYEVPRDSP